MRCRGAAGRVGGLGEGGEPPALLARHVSSCRRCQAELARYQRLVRLLSQLRAEQSALRPGVLADIVDAIGEVAEDRTSRAAPTGEHLALTASVVGALLAATVIMLAARSRCSRQGAAAGQCYP